MSPLFSSGIIKRARFRSSLLGSSYFVIPSSMDSVVGQQSEKWWVDFMMARELGKQKVPLGKAAVSELFSDPDSQLVFRDKLMLLVDDVCNKMDQKGLTTTRDMCIEAARTAIDYTLNTELSSGSYGGGLALNKWFSTT